VRFAIDTLACVIEGNLMEPSVHHTRNHWPMHFVEHHNPARLRLR
jgi:hypothetical protein